MFKKIWLGLQRLSGVAVKNPSSENIRIEIKTTADNKICLLFNKKINIIYLDKLQALDPDDYQLKSF
jgi:hypothetical protein